LVKEAWQQFGGYSSYETVEVKKFVARYADRYSPRLDRGFGDFPAIFEVEDMQAEKRLHHNVQRITSLTSSCRGDSGGDLEGLDGRISGQELVCFCDTKHALEKAGR
jgi:hypothetical protein